MPVSPYEGFKVCTSCEEKNVLKTFCCKSSSHPVLPSLLQRLCQKVKKTFPLYRQGFQQDKQRTYMRKQNNPFCSQVDNLRKKRQFGREIKEEGEKQDGP
jgi:hypothetical protein